MIFDIKPSHFKDGWAVFDAMNRNQLAVALKHGCKLVPNGYIVKTAVLLKAYPELMCFGRVSEEGQVIIEGITGFPSNDACLRVLEGFSHNVRKKKITPSYVYVEW